MSGEFRVAKFVCPMVVILGTLIVYWAPWMTAQSTDFLPLSFSVSLRDLLRQSLPETLWFWASVLGILVVVCASADSDIDRTRMLTRIGGVLFLAFPVKTLWHLLVEETDGASIAPGWGLWASVAVAITLFVLAPRIAED